MKILNVILYILLCILIVFLQGSREINVKYDYICVFPPYSSKEYIEKEIGKYVASSSCLRYFEPSSDDGWITRAAIYNQKLIYIKNEIRENELSYEAGCRRNH